MFSSIGVALWLCLDYAIQYINRHDGFVFFVWFEDVSFTRAQHDFQLMMATSWVDVASRIVFASDLLLCMEQIKDLREPTTDHHKKLHARPPRAAAVAPHPLSGSTAAQDGPQHMPHLPSTLDRAAPVIFAAWRLIVLIAHCLPHSASPDTGCRMRVHPWFLGQPACALAEIDCFAHQVDGSLSSIEQFDDPAFVSRLVSRHCSQLEIPHTILKSSNLTSFKVYNSTVTS